MFLSFVLCSFSVGAIKSTMRDVILNIRPPPPERETTMTNLVLDFAKVASSEEWIDMFDVLIGTLIGLLHRFVEQKLVACFHLVEKERIKGGLNLTFVFFAGSL